MEMLHVPKCVKFVSTVNRPNLFYMVQFLVTYVCGPIDLLDDLSGGHVMSCIAGARKVIHWKGGY